MRRWGSRGGFWLSKRKFRIWVCSERKGEMESFERKRRERGAGKDKNKSKE